MATKPKAKKATQPVAQPAPEPVQNSTATQSTPLVFIQSGKVVAVTEAELKAKARKALDERQALKRSQAEARHFRDSQQAMRRQPKGIQALGRTLWKLWD